MHWGARGFCLVGKSTRFPLLTRMSKKTALAVERRWEAGTRIRAAHVFSEGLGSRAQRLPRDRSGLRGLDGLVPRSN